MAREDRQRIGVAALIFAAGLGFALCFRADDKSDAAPPARPMKASEAYAAMAHWYEVTEDCSDLPWDVSKPIDDNGAAPRPASAPRRATSLDETPRTFAEAEPELNPVSDTPERPSWLSADVSANGYEFSPR
jgi:hypothetical protein